MEPTPEAVEQSGAWYILAGQSGDMGAVVCGEIVFGSGSHGKGNDGGAGMSTATCGMDQMLHGSALEASDTKLPEASPQTPRGGLARWLRPVNVAVRQGAEPTQPVWHSMKPTRAEGQGMVG